MVTDLSYKTISRWVTELSVDIERWEVSELSDDESRHDAFSSDLRFGTGGIRCLMGVGPNRMNRLTIGKAAQGLADWLLERTGEASVAIGYDTRIHSHEFAEVTTCVLAANGIHTYLFQSPQPTPVLDFAVRELGCSAGVVITASHNPREYNGFKVYDAQGVQATDAMARAIQAKIELVDPFEDVKPLQIEEAVTSGLVEPVGDELLVAYWNAVLAQRLGIDCSELSVVYSPLNGTGLAHALHVLDELGVTHSVVEEQAEPDGNFPHCPKPNPENRDAMAAGMEQMARLGTDLFLATDPDADRVGVACIDGGKPRLLTGNEVGLLLFDFVCRHHSMPTTNAVAVTTVVTAPLADTIAEANGIELRRTLTGFKYVGEQIGRIEAESGQFLLGIEESDGYLRGSYVRDKDGINALMLVCEVAAHYKAEGKTLTDALEELYERYGHMPGKQLVQEFPGASGKAAMDRLMGMLRASAPISIAGLEVESEIDYLPGAAMPAVGGECDQKLPPANVLEWRLAGGSRVIVRPSGTEPKLKAYVFAKRDTEEGAAALLDNLCANVTRLISVPEVKSESEGGHVIHVVLLSGGSGTRLWPLSNSARSKQFLKVLRDTDGNHISMVQRVFGQIDAVDADIDITIATSASQADALAMQVGGRYQLSVEPERRDTAPAIMLACAHLDLVQGADPDDPVVVMPIDTFADQAYYDRIPMVADAVTAGTSELVLLGVRPTYPSEKYGYILPASTNGGLWPVDTFREKPDEATARVYIERGGLWNCGVFGFRLGWLRDLTRGHVDTSSFDELVERYRELPKNSFDYEVVERAESISVVPYSGTWKDLGTWNTLCEEMAEETSGPVWVDGATTSNVHAVNETGLPMVVAGLSDAVVVATPDGILVSGKETSDHVKRITALATKDHPMHVIKSWGEYSIKDITENTRIVTASIKKGEEVIIYLKEKQKHSCTIISGNGFIKIKNKKVNAKRGSCIEIIESNTYSIFAETIMHMVIVEID